MINLDKYLEEIQEEPIQELWPFAIGMAALWGLLVWGIYRETEKSPKHPKWNKIWKESEKMHEMCAERFPDETTKIKVGASGKESYAGFDYDSYKANPERIKCQMMARIKTLKKYIEWVSKVKAEEVCKYNKEKFQKDCMLIVERVKQSSIGELRDLNRLIANSSEKKPLNKMQFDKIDKVLGMKKRK